MNPDFEFAPFQIELMETLDALEKDQEISSDDKERFSKDLDRYTQQAVDEIDRALTAKEQELLEV